MDGAYLIQKSNQIDFRTINIPIKRLNNLFHSFLMKIFCSRRLQIWIVFATWGLPWYAVRWSPVNFPCGEKFHWDRFLIMAMVVTPVQRTPARRGFVGSQGTGHGCLAAVPQNLVAFVLSKWR